MLTKEDFDEMMSGKVDPYKMLADTMRRAQETHRRYELLRSENTALDDPVYEEIESISLLASYSGDELDLEEHIAELREIAAKAPEGCRVVVEYEREGDYDGPDIFMRRIGFYRPLTDEERRAREAENAERDALKAEAAADAEAMERAEFERLNAKFAQR